MEPPPPVLAGLYVAAFAHADDSVRFEQRHTLSVDGVWLGRVPNLALCQNFETSEFMIQHCSQEWAPLGIAAGYRSIEEAKQRVERSYPGIGAKWIGTTTSKEEAHALYEAELKAESCSFCGRTIAQVTAMIGDEVRICNHCVESFHKAIRSDDKAI